MYYSALETREKTLRNMRLSNDFIQVLRGELAGIEAPELIDEFGEALKTREIKEEIDDYTSDVIKCAVEVVSGEIENLDDDLNSDTVDTLKDSGFVFADLNAEDKKRLLCDLLDLQRTASVADVYSALKEFLEPLALEEMDRLLCAPAPKMEIKRVDISKGLTALHCPYCSEFLGSTRAGLFKVKNGRCKCGAKITKNYAEINN